MLYSIYFFNINVPA